MSPGNRSNSNTTTSTRRPLPRLLPRLHPYRRSSSSNNDREVLNAPTTSENGSSVICDGRLFLRDGTSAGDCPSVVAGVSDSLVDLSSSSRRLSRRDIESNVKSSMLNISELTQDGSEVAMPEDDDRNSLIIVEETTPSTATATTVAQAHDPNFGSDIFANEAAFAELMRCHQESSVDEPVMREICKIMVFGDKLYDLMKIIGTKGAHNLVMGIYRNGIDLMNMVSLIHSIKMVYGYNGGQCALNDFFLIQRTCQLVDQFVEIFRKCKNLNYSVVAVTANARFLELMVVKKWGSFLGGNNLLNNTLRNATIYSTCGNAHMNTLFVLNCKYTKLGYKRRESRENSLYFRQVETGAQFNNIKNENDLVSTMLGILDPSGKFCKENLPKTYIYPFAFPSHLGFYVVNYLNKKYT